MMRASSCAFSAAIAPVTLVARSYSNGAGVCISLLVLADHRRAARPLGGVERAGGEAAGGRVAQRRAVRTGGRDRRLAAEPRERQRAARVDLADARRRRGAEPAEAFGPRA